MSRSVERVIESVRTMEGAGFAVRRPFPTPTLNLFDPFLLLDEMGPTVYGPGEAVGAPDHPHRGFETVTYVLDGKMAHADSAGHAGTIGPGDVQWMTAGAGVVHSEMPDPVALRDGGRMHGFQLWVNLPRAEKMMAPRYQEVPSATIPTATSDDGLVWVRVIAGAALGAAAVIETRTPITYLHASLKPGGRLEQPVPVDHAAFAYVFAGEGQFGPDGRRGADGDMVQFAEDGESVVIANDAPANAALELLLLTGVPLREPVARYGPFVMNTREEIVQAVEDYQAGRMGRISA